MFDSLENIIKLYFKQNNKFLKSQYPGLPLNRLLDEAIDFLRIKKGHWIKKTDHILESSLKSFFGQLETGKPLEYISGQSYFFNSSFKVNEHVLIPRSETEVLVDYVEKYISSLNERITIVDIGTGSGNIIISLAQLLSTGNKLIGVDICENALSVAKRNAFHLSYSFDHKTELSFRRSDLLEQVPEPLDIIVSNPPYYQKDKDFEIVHDQVKKFEPSGAVFIDDEVFNSWYNSFFKQCSEKLRPSGDLILETDSQYTSLLIDFAKEHNFSLIKKFSDLAGRERFLHLKRISNG